VNDEHSSKRVGRKRRLFGWTLIALGLLVAGAWAWSLKWRLFYLTPQRTVFQLSGGCAGVATSLSIQEHPRLHEGMVTESHRQPILWSWEFYASGNMRSIFVPLWPIPFVLWAAGVPLLRSGIVARRRADTGACGKCGYSLAGLGVDAKCPECGK